VILETESARETGMTARTKLGWVEIPWKALRQGLACGEGGVRIMLMVADDRAPAGSSPAPTTPPDALSDADSAEKPR
jgi:hypothetical protein